MSDVRIEIVLGSVTPPGRMHGAVLGAAQRAGEAGIAQVAVLDLAEARIGFAGAAPAEDDGLSAAAERLRAADAVLFASPVYRASFTGVLKNFLDLLPLDTLEGKPVGVMAMGNNRDHALGVERHLRDVLAWFGVVAAPTTVFLSAADFEAGVLQAAPAADLDALVTTLARLATATRPLGRELPLRPPAAREG
ncbi:MAG: NADPH-dependent FMN reductase [Dehalococcoidia bacterium]